MIKINIVFSLLSSKNRHKIMKHSLKNESRPRVAPIPNIAIRSVCNRAFSFAGVCFLVGSLFMAMVGLEMLFEKAMEKYDSMRGKNEAPEAHPADLVGKFSRYK